MTKVYKRIVIKVGSSLFCSKKNGFDKGYFNNFIRQVKLLSSLGDEKREIVIVSSGAIALGMHLWGFKNRPKKLPELQAVAATGQNILMDYFSNAFRAHKISVPSQILLTWDDFDNRVRYLNAKNTILTLLKLGSIPIVNENDTVSTEEIKFGDNDRLSALVATMISADLLVILSDVDGLLDENKNLVRLVPEITNDIRSLANPSNKNTSVGGMITKIDAAKIAVDSGIPCVIANGGVANRICAIAVDPFNVNPLDKRDWTVFYPKGSLGERDRWIAFGTKPKGKIIVDDGAKKALLNSKSLLSVGITAVERNFEDGSVVSVMDRSGTEFARGKVSVSSKVIDEFKGRHFAREIIHRDNIVILN
jgi:glutamate 5-kinase